MMSLQKVIGKLKRQSGGNLVEAALKVCLIMLIAVPSVSVLSGRVSDKLDEVEVGGGTTGSIGDEDIHAPTPTPEPCQGIGCPAEPPIPTPVPPDPI